MVSFKERATRVLIGGLISLVFGFATFVVFAFALLLGFYGAPYGGDPVPPAEIAGVAAVGLLFLLGLVAGLFILIPAFRSTPSPEEG